jgi:hypothetical protein
MIRETNFGRLKAFINCISYTVHRYPAQVGMRANAHARRRARKKLILIHHNEKVPFERALAFFWNR